MSSYSLSIHFVKWIPELDELMVSYIHHLQIICLLNYLWIYFRSPWKSRRCEKHHGVKLRMLIATSWLQLSLLPSTVNVRSMFVCSPTLTSKRWRFGLSLSGCWWWWQCKGPKHHPLSHHRESSIHPSIRLYRQWPNNEPSVCVWCRLNESLSWSIDEIWMTKYSSWINSWIVT